MNAESETKPKPTPSAASACRRHRPFSVRGTQGAFAQVGTENRPCGILVVVVRVNHLLQALVVLLWHLAKRNSPTSQSQS